MTLVNARASLAVADLDAAAPWFERRLGPRSRPMDEVMERLRGRVGGLQVYTGPERAGQGSCTPIVDDIDATASHLRTTDLVDDPQVMGHERVDTIMIKNRDSGSIAFSAPKDLTLAH